jgi:hypothetical protein
MTANQQNILVNGQKMGCSDGPLAVRDNHYLSRVVDILFYAEEIGYKDEIWKTIMMKDPNINSDLTWSSWTYVK